MTLAIPYKSNLAPRQMTKRSKTYPNRLKIRERVAEFRKQFPTEYKAVIKEIAVQAIYNDYSVYTVEGVLEGRSENFQCLQIVARCFKCTLDDIANPDYKLHQKLLS